MSGLLVTGATGQLGSYLLSRLRGGSQPFVAWNGTRDVDLLDARAVLAALGELAPTTVLHTAALARVGDCVRAPDRARAINTDATALLAEQCARLRARLVFVSTDMVFDGEHAPYREDDPTRALSVYAATKRDAERAVLAHPTHLVVRISLLYGPALSGRPTFFDDTVTALRTGKPITLFTDEWRTPLDFVTAADALLALCASAATGLLHLGGPERLSRWEMGERLARFLNLDPAPLRPTRRQDAPASEPRPRDLALDSTRWRARVPQLPWPSYEDALRRMGLSSGAGERGA